MNKLLPHTHFLHLNHLLEGFINPSLGYWIPQVQREHRGNKIWGKTAMWPKYFTSVLYLLMGQGWEGVWGFFLVGCRLGFFAFLTGCRVLGFFSEWKMRGWILPAEGSELMKSQYSQHSPLPGHLQACWGSPQEGSGMWERCNPKETSINRSLHTGHRCSCFPPLCLPEIFPSCSGAEQEKGIMESCSISSSQDGFGDDGRALE